MKLNFPLLPLEGSLFRTVFKRVSSTTQEKAVPKEIAEEGKAPRAGDSRKFLLPVAGGLMMGAMGPVPW